MGALDDLQEKLGYAFQRRALLHLAMTHPSMAHEPQEAVHTNQRLEFLGDAVLQLVLTRQLYDKFPDLGEGPLTKARAQLVNRRTLASHARRLELGHYLILSRGEELHGGRERISALADAFEAVVGAILLDSGFESAREFVLREFAGSFGDVPVVPKLHNPKGELQEFIQSFSTVPPRYRIISVTGPDHDREFECTVEHEGSELASGRGKSKKTAESAAAVAALEYIKKRRHASSVAAMRRKRKSTRKRKPKREDAA